ncbi:DUF488 domain-containing protein [Elongatibacter sediminis]|uniref:DUF488 family protein n=1 Tax=Elongatibacter sediminis TaxID=3119006 RepID=A0AAW9RCW2_9GAMM
MDIRTRRIYQEPSRSDGLRVLVDRLWPRGVSKEDAALDAWLKSLAPSDELRKWFHEHPDEWSQFCARYHDELDQQDEVVDDLLERIGEGRATLLYASRDSEHNNAVALQSYLQHRQSD